MSNVINIIDRQFNFLGQIDNYESLILTKSYSGIGTFELHLHESTLSADKLQKENIIFTTPNKAYIILFRSLVSSDGRFTVKGLELKSYLKRLVTFPPAGQAYHRVNSNVETIMKEYVAAQLNRRNITDILVAINQNRGITTVYQTRYKNLADELEKLSLASGLGWDIVLDIENKKFVFDVYEGQDRTVNQDILPPAIFAVEYDNIGKQELIDSRMNYANVAIVGGQGEGADREIAVVGNATGLDAYEVFIDARDISAFNDLLERGKQKLSEMQETFTFESEVLNDRNLKNEKDFNLGDIVTVQNKKWRVILDTRIAAVTEIYEADGYKLDITFGSSIPTLIDVVKKTIDMPVVEGGSQGQPGTPGDDGVGLEFTWDGTKLGVKREDEENYQYVDLEGPQGPQGIQGPPGEPSSNSWDDITGKPSTFPPSEHGHTKLDNIDSLLFSRCVYSTVISSANAGSYIKLDIPEITASGNSRYYSFDLIGCNAIGTMESQLLYSIAIHRRSYQNINVQIIEHMGGANTKLSFYTKIEGTYKVDFYIKCPNGYTEIAIIDKFDGNYVKTTKNLWSNLGKVAIEGLSQIEPLKAWHSNMDINMADNILQSPEIKDYAESITTITGSGAKTLDISTANVFNITPSGAMTLAFSNPSASGRACSMTVIIRMPSTLYAVTYPSSVKWDGDKIPEFKAGKAAYLTFVTINGGLRWHGFVSGTDFAT